MPLVGGGHDWLRMRPVGRFPLLLVTRRAVLAGLVAIGVVPQVRGQHPSPALASSVLAETLRAFLDTLVPADAATPSAGSLGLHIVLLQESTTRTNYVDLLQQGTDWLDQQAHSLGADGFASATESAQNDIVSAAFAAEADTLPSVFANFIRQDVMRLYYARPEGWVGMIDGPPQPTGYLQAHLPPEERG